MLTWPTEHHHLGLQGLMSDTKPNLGNQKLELARENAARDSAALVDIDGVRKTFGYKVALKDVTFSVPAGQICGLLGPNGAGKTTLFRLLMGILKATQGKLLIDGRDAFEDRVEVKKLIGFLPDEPVFYSYLSGYEVLELSAAMHGLDVAGTMQRIAPVISQLRLTTDINNYAEDYSRGMKKKLGLLLAMLHEPKVVFLDEPTIGLDVVAKEAIREFIARTNRDRGTTYILTTHDLNDVEKLCARIIIIDHGKKIYDGSIDAIKQQYGGKRVLTADLADQCADIDIRLPGATVVSREGHRIQIEFDRALLRADELIVALAKYCEIKDVTIAEPELEAIIRQIYQRGLDPMPAAVTAK